MGCHQNNQRKSCKHAFSAFLTIHSCFRSPFTGILFNGRNKILLTEKFIGVEFLVQFPTYEFTLKPDIEQLIQRLSQMWVLPSIFCPLNFSSHFSSNSSGFNVNWMLFQINHELREFENDLTIVRNETSMFLRPPSEPNPTRTRRGASAL